MSAGVGWRKNFFFEVWVTKKFGQENVSAPQCPPRPSHVNVIGILAGSLSPREPARRLPPAINNDWSLTDFNTELFHNIKL
jgi:hypothetical protein